MPKNTFYNLVLLLSLTLFAKNLWAQGEDQAYFLTGIKAYQSEQFDEASMAFQKSLEISPNNPATHYNLARTLYQTEVWPLALAHARKAAFLNPDLKEALQLIPFLETKLSVSSERKFKALPLFVEEIVIASKLWLLAVINIIFLLIFAVRAIKFLGQRRNALREELPLPKLNTSVFIYLTLFLFSFSLVVAKVVFESKSYATVIVEKAQLKSGPKGEEATLLEINPGLELEVMKSYEGWFQVRLADELVGWIQNSSVFITKEGF